MIHHQAQATTLDYVDELRKTDISLVWTGWVISINHYSTFSRKQQPLLPWVKVERAGPSQAKEAVTDFYVARASFPIS